MHKFTGTVIGAFLLVHLVAVPTPAQAANADCAALIKDAQGRMAAMPANHSKREVVRNMLDNASKSLEKGKKKKCNKQATKAVNLMEKLGF